MHARQAADDRVVFDHDVPRQRRVVGHDHAVADDAVVRHVAIGHDQAFRSHAGFAVVERRAIQRGAFADHGVFPHREPRRAALVLQILRLAAHAGERPDFAPRPQRRVAVHAHVRAQGHAVAQPRVRPHEAERTDRHVLAQLRAGLDHRQRMDRDAHAYLPPPNIISASHASSPSTSARPDTFAMPNRSFRNLISIRNWSPGTTIRRNFALSTPR